MAVPRKTAYAILLSLALLDAILRFPQGQNELGADSFIIHGLSQVLVDHGFAEWILNPLSVFGLFPLSYPSGPIFLLVNISALGNVSLSGSVVLLDMLTAVLGTMGAFAMAREFNPDTRFALLGAFAFSLAPRFVGTTIWQVPTRTFFTAMIPWFVWSILAFRRHPGLRGAGVFLACMVVMMTSHRLAILMAIVVAAYVVAAILVAAVRLVRLTYAGSLLRPSVKRLFRVGSWTMFLAAALYFVVFSGTLDAYSSGQLIQGAGVLPRLLNLGVSVTRSSGILLPLAAFGIAPLIHARNRDLKQPWLLLTFIGLLPTLSLRQYIGAYLPPFVAIFVALGLLWILGRLERRKRAQVALVACALVGAVASTVVIVHYDMGLLEPLTSEVDSGGLYLRYALSGTYVANDGLLGAQLNAISGKPYMPIGGATTAAQGPEVLAFGFMDPRDVKVRLIPLTQLTLEDDSVFELDLNLEQTWAILLSHAIDERGSQTTLTRYSVAVYVEDLTYSGHFFAFGINYSSPFGVSVSKSCYVIYASPSYLVYTV